jgi:hypothetical protein
MVPAARWLVVGGIALALVAPPLAVRALPARSSHVSAVTLAHRTEHATDVSWSGEVRTRGSLSLPLTGSTFGGLARLLGDEDSLRVWWRDADTWRVDRIRSSGESDLVRNGGLSVRWSYEDGQARYAAYSAIRLPDDNDVLPPALAARLLEGAHRSELSRLPARRVAGASAAGLRLVPAGNDSTIARVDVWVDEVSGLPLRVEVYGEKDLRRPVLTSEMTRFHAGDPGDGPIHQRLSPGVQAAHGETLDDVASTNAFAPFLLPMQVIGLARHGAKGALGAVGVFGRGPTAVLAVPLRGFTADELHRQLARSHRARETAHSVALEVGPLSVLLVQYDWASFLLTGTVRPDSLQDAAGQLLRGTVRTQ